MRALLERGADPKQVFYSESSLWWGETTAAFEAVATCNKEMLELMLEFGVPADAMLDGSTLLLKAIEEDHDGVVRRDVLMLDAKLLEKQSFSIFSCVFLWCASN
jgi:hypothetical protein